MMRRRACVSIVLVVSLLSALASPDRSWGFIDFSEDALKSAGIIMGITAGVVLLVVLVAGTVKDIKGGEREEEDIWANARGKQTLARLPPLLGGALLVEEMKQAGALFRSVPPALPEGGRGFCGKSDGTCNLNPALFHIPGRDDIRSLKARSPNANDPNPGDALPRNDQRLACFWSETLNNGCTP